LIRNAQAALTSSSTFSGLLLKQTSIISAKECKDDSSTQRLLKMSINYLEDIDNFKAAKLLVVYILRTFGRFCKIIKQISKLWENPYKHQPLSSTSQNQ